MLGGMFFCLLRVSPLTPLGFEVKLLVFATAILNLQTSEFAIFLVDLFGKTEDDYGDIALEHPIHLHDCSHRLTAGAAENIHTFASLYL